MGDKVKGSEWGKLFGMLDGESVEVIGLEKEKVVVVKS